MDAAIAVLTSDIAAHMQAQMNLQICRMNNQGVMQVSGTLGPEFDPKVMNTNMLLGLLQGLQAQMVQVNALVKAIQG